MKLIDLDKVRWTEGFYDMHTGEQYASMMFNTEEWLEWATAEAEVKAIPIEWLEMFMRRYKIEGNDEYKLLHFMVTEWEKWEKENDKDSE